MTPTKSTKPTNNSHDNDSRFFSSLQDALSTEFCCDSNTCMHTDANASVTDDLSEGGSSHQPHLAAVPQGSITINPPSLGGLLQELQQEIVTAILDSGADLCTLSEDLVRRKGLKLVPSSHLARLGDGTIVKSTGSADVVFLFQNT